MRVRESEGKRRDATLLYTRGAFRMGTLGKMSMRIYVPLALCRWLGGIKTKHELLTCKEEVCPGSECESESESENGVFRSHLFVSFEPTCHPSPLLTRSSRPL